MSMKVHQGALTLHNNYWTLRHGQSKANLQGLIVSSTSEGVKQEYALTEVGRHQARQAGQKLAQQLQGDSQSISIFSSPFSRTTETATAVAVANRVAEATIEVSPELRERHFGCYDLQSHDNYGKVWAEDARSPDFRPQGGGESVREVADRVRQLIDRIESTRRGQNVVLVAHGDTLSVVWALVKGTPLEQHRNVALDTGELRQLNAMEKEA